MSAYPRWIHKVTTRTAYVSGRVGQEARTRDLVAALNKLGYHVMVDWTTLDVRKPYRENRAHNAKAARQMAEGARDADCFVLLIDDDLLGAYIESGIAIGASISGKHNRVYIVGRNVRDSIFYTLPAVRLVATTGELIEQLSAYSRLGQD